MESHGEPFADEWSSRPGWDIFANAYLVATSCADHLLALADVLKAGNCLNATYTLTRAAAEAAALGCYLTGSGIDARERLRRNNDAESAEFDVSKPDLAWIDESYFSRDCQPAGVQIPVQTSGG